MVRLHPSSPLLLPTFILQSPHLRMAHSGQIVRSTRPEYSQHNSRRHCTSLYLSKEPSAYAANINGLPYRPVIAGLLFNCCLRRLCLQRADIPAPHFGIRTVLIGALFLALIPPANLPLAADQVAPEFGEEKLPFDSLAAAHRIRTHCACPGHVRPIRTAEDVTGNASTARTLHRHH